MVKKILKAYLISIIILILLSFSYSLFLYFSQNDSYYNIVTLIIGVIFFFLLGLFGIKAFNKQIILVSLGYFLITYALFLIIFFLADGDFSYKIILKAIICLISTIIGSFIGKK